MPKSTNEYCYNVGYRDFAKGYDPRPTHFAEQYHKSYIDGWNQAIVDFKNNELETVDSLKFNRKNSNSNV
jgi:hypothetical protein